MPTVTRPLVTVGIPFLIVALAVSYFSPFETAALVIVLLVAFFLFFIVLDKKKRISILLIIFGGIAAASSYYIFARNEVDLSLFNLDEGEITARVLDFETDGNKKSYTLKVLENSFSDMPNGYNAILYTKTDEDIRVNDIISFHAKANSIESIPSFDMERYCRSENISLKFSTYNEVKVIKKGSKDFFYYAKELNLLCGEVFDKYLSQPFSGLMKAVLLGNKNGIELNLYNKIVRSGVSHIFVVSGLHISLLAMIIFGLLKLLFVPLRIRSFLTIVAAWLFAAVTGFGLPAVRAAIIMSVLMAGNLFGRKPDSLSSLFLAGIIIVLINPYAIMSGSFLLSFSATLGIILFSKSIENFFLRRFNLIQSDAVLVKPIRYLLGIIAATLASNIGMLPVILYIFKGISIIAPITNLIVIPLLPLILVIGVLILFMSSIPFIVLSLSKLLEFLLSVICNTCEFLSGFKFSYIGLDYNFVYIWLWIAIILLAAVFIYSSCSARDSLKRLMLNTSYIAAGALLISTGFNVAYNYSNVQITTINSFNAQSVIIAHEGKASVIASGDDGYIDVSVENFLRSKNIRLIENYIFTSNEKKNIADTEFLSNAIKICNIYCFDDDELLSYAKDCFSPQNGVYALKHNGGFDISDLYMSLDRLYDEVLINLNIGHTNITITNSPVAAAEKNCEILYYSGIYDKKIKQNNAKYVIILNEPIPKRLINEFDKFKIFKAYENQTELSIRLNGNYKF